MIPKHDPLIQTNKIFENNAGIICGLVANVLVCDIVVREFEF